MEQNKATQKQMRAAIMNGRFLRRDNEAAYYLHNGLVYMLPYNSSLAVVEEPKHFIRVHRPFSHPKQWVCGPFDALTFTENQSECGKYTRDQADAIIADLESKSAGGGFVIELDGL